MQKRETWHEGGDKFSIWKQDMSKLMQNKAKLAKKLLLPLLHSAPNFCCWILDLGGWRMPLKIKSGLGSHCWKEWGILISLKEIFSWFKNEKLGRDQNLTSPLETLFYIVVSKGRLKVVPKDSAQGLEYETWHWLCVSFHWKIKRLTIWHQNSNGDSQFWLLISFSYECHRTTLPLAMESFLEFLLAFFCHCWWMLMYVVFHILLHFHIQSSDSAIPSIMC